MTPSPRPERLPASGNLVPWAVTAVVPSHQRITIDDGRGGGPACLDGAEVAVDAEAAGGQDGHRAQGPWVERCISRLKRWRGIATDTTGPRPAT
ncbi:hypothetical protein [Streptomyces sp. NBC_00996]|uniref:hypothetical protein n=1 Tax=Streptomyces sp. NBC_00996 TaxID=2903710 RepID=UPI003866CE24|nr:hypothetical protein OG390_06425 [Streptomyces sp. NBC_00996]